MEGGRGRKKDIKKRKQTQPLALRKGRASRKWNGRGGLEGPATGREVENVI